MKAEYIDYHDTGYFSSLMLRYLQQDEALSPFISHQPDLNGFKQLIDTKTVTADREILVKVLKEQYGESLKLKAENKKPILDNIELLAEENTYTVTTGHQLNIFTGPLYFLYKIVTAINLAKELKQQFPDKNFVPVYWMASEDHDFAEINHTNIHGKKISWNEQASGAVGRLSTKSITDAVKAYRDILGLSENAEKLSEIISEAYLQRTNLADATRFLVNSLFGKYGLVILDADHPELKKKFAPIIEQDIIGQHSFKTITESSTELEKSGFKTQVNAREINFFYLKDNLRERITQEGDFYYILNTDIRFSEQELKTEIQDYPERFSPNVIMRPLYQEVILPNLAYIGGGGELAYWFQLKKNFDFYQIDFPILILRNSALIAGENQHDKLIRLGLSWKDIFKKNEDIQKEWVLKHSSHTLTLNDEWKELSCIFEKIKLRAYKIDPTLSPSADAVKARLHKAVSNLEKKLIKAEKRNHSGALSQIENIKNRLFPGGGLQERFDNFGLFYVKYGDKLIEELIHHFKPLDFKFTILEP